VTLPTFYRWPFLIGGPADGADVPEDSFEKRRKAVTVDGETYYWRKHNFGPAIFGFYLAEYWPKIQYPPFELGRRIFNSHPNLVEVPPDAECD
jgi:hypothetical protein